MITDEKLMAYVDGELPAGERNAIEAALARDEQLQNTVAVERLLRRKLADLYDPALEEQVPEQLKRLLEAEDNVLPLKRPSSAPARGRWQTFTAMAASLVLGLFLGHGLIGGGVQDEAGLQVGEHVATALQAQLASTQNPADPVQIGISFAGPNGQPCRTFESTEAAGLACRQGNDWQVRLLAPKAVSRGSEYQQAGSASALVMGSAQELIVGEPMTAEQERAARDAGWPARSE